MPQNTFDDKSILVQIVVWCRWATSYYLNQSWPKSVTKSWLPDFEFTKTPHTTPSRASYGASVADILEKNRQKRSSVLGNELHNMRTQFCCAKFCCGKISSLRVYVDFVLIFVRVAPLSLGQSYDCHSACGVVLTHGWYDNKIAPSKRKLGCASAMLLL